MKPPADYWRWRIGHRVRRFRWWISDPETLAGLADCCGYLIAAWIFLGMLVLALWAGAQ